MYIPGIEPFITKGLSFAIQTPPLAVSSVYLIDAASKEKDS